MTVRHLLNRYVLFAVIAVFASNIALASDRKTTNMLLGAGLGAAAGAVLSEGDPMLTLGGAAAGGLLGNVLTEEKRYSDRHIRRHYKGSKHHHKARHRHVSKRYGHPHKRHHKSGKHHRRHR